MSFRENMSLLKNSFVSFSAPVLSTEGPSLGVLNVVRNH